MVRGSGNASEGLGEERGSAAGAGGDEGIAGAREEESCGCVRLGGWE